MIDKTSNEHLKARKKRTRNSCRLPRSYEASVPRQSTRISRSFLPSFQVFLGGFVNHLELLGDSHRKS